MWTSIASHSLTFILGAGMATFVCMCDLNHPDRPLPPLK